MAFFIPRKTKPPEGEKPRLDLPLRESIFNEAEEGGWWNGRYLENFAGNLGELTPVNSPEIIDGDHGAAFKLAEASTQYYTAAHGRGFLESLTAYSFIVVVKGTGTDSNYSNVFNFNGSMQLRHSTTNWDFYHEASTGWKLARWASGYKENERQILVGTWDSSKIRLYSEGKLLATTACANWNTASARDILQIGADQSATAAVAGSYWEGEIYDLIWMPYIFLDGDEAKRRSVDPYSTLKKRRKLWVVPSATDATAPILSSPTGTKTGSTTADGAVSTDEANGTLYYLATTNASETAATIKAGSSQAVTATGSQAVSFMGLTAATVYYAHYVHDDAATNTSNVQSSAGFTTDAAVTTIAPLRRRMMMRSA